MLKISSFLAFLEPKKTITIYLAAVVMVIILFAIFSSVIDNKAVRDQENAFNLQQALQTLVAGKGIEQHLEDRARTLSVLTEYSLVDYENGLRSAGSLEQLFRVETATYPEYLSILYVKSRNDPGFVYHRETSMGVEAQRVGLLWAWMYFDGAAAHPDQTGLWIPPLVVNQANQLIGLVLPVPVDGDLRGVLVVVEDIKPIIERYIVPMRSGQQGAAYLVDSQGNILYDHNPELIGRNIFDGLHSPYPDLVRFDRRMMEEDKGIDEYHFTVQPGGEVTRQLVAWYSVLVGGQKLVIALAAPGSEIDTNLTDFRLQRNLLSGALGILLILTSVAFFYSRQQLLEQNAKNLQQLVALRTRELTASEEALRSSSELLQALFNASPLAIIQVDADDRVLLWNPASEQIFGWSPVEILGKTNPIIPQEKNDEYTRIVSNLEKGNSYSSFEAIRQRKDGSLVWVSVATSALLDQAGNLRGRMAIIADISARKQAESEVIERNKELEELAIENALLYQKTQTHAGELEQHVRERTVQLENAVHELESFSYSVSHDLRSPLRSISGFSQLLTEEFDSSLDGTAKDYLNRIRLSSQRMAELIDDLLNLARLGRTDMICETVNLSTLAQNVADELSARNDQREVHFSIEPNLIAQADLHLMQVVITNLLENAWKFTSNRTLASIEFGSITQEGLLVYFVRDNGAGFDMQYSNKLFGPFQRLHSTQEFEGTGIGLATVQRIIRRHGGRIWAESEPDRGAVFYFTLAGG